ncbi:MAG: hypothetical protein LAO78_17330 [Acidobacteriia bacterium]|nr:hypothetical protein [Terriglobia bacterium]
MSDSVNQDALELRKLRLDERRYLADIVKWVIVAIGTVVSFYVIDVGKLNLEKFKASAENQRLLLKEYLTATETVQPEVWKRKLHVLANYSDDPHIRSWSEVQLKYIQDYAEKDALYRETLKVSSQLVHWTSNKDPQRELARTRFEQLYWADLPFAKEDAPVIAGMIEFRRVLLLAEAKPNDPNRWASLDIALIQLAKALKESQPKDPTL